MVSHQTHRISQQFDPNIIIFGEAGTGKSSVINMILGHDKAKVSNGLRGETFKSTSYPIKLDGKTYNLHDTVGLGEHSRGTVDSAKAAKNLYRLLTVLSNSGGVNLLVFVIKCGQRLTQTMHKNYTLFHDGFCNSKVPIVIVVTCCENVEPMDTWWIDNERLFTQARMPFNGHACVCAFKGGKTKQGDYRNEDLVEKSVGVVQQLIVLSCMPDGWKKVRHPQLRRPNLPKHFQSSRQLFGFDRLSDHSQTSFGRRKYPLSTPNSSIASQKPSPPRKQKVLSKRYPTVRYQPFF